MKKFFKFIFKLAAMIAAGYGIYQAAKKYGFLDQKQDEADEDLVEDLDDFDLDEDKEDSEEEAPKAPEYVSIMPEKEEQTADQIL